jgi:hypothetical protein
MPNPNQSIVMLDDDAGLNLALRRPFNAFKANAACAESASYITPKSFSQRIRTQFPPISKAVTAKTT